MNQEFEKKISTDVITEKFVQKFSAMLTIDEANLLFNLAKNSDKKGVIVEIGSYKGGSTIILAKGSDAGEKNIVYTVDPHTPKPEEYKIGTENIPKNVKPIFLANIKKSGYENKIVPIFEYSNQAAKKWNKPISLLWIDGDHNYSSVKKDILSWEKYLIAGGIIAFHDTTDSTNKIALLGINASRHQGVYSAIKKFIISSGKFKNIKFVDSIAYMQKSEKTGYFWNLKNITVLKIKISKITLSKWINRWIGLVGNITKKISPKIYKLLKPFFK